MNNFLMMFFAILSAIGFFGILYYFVKNCGRMVRRARRRRERLNDVENYIFELKCEVRELKDALKKATRAKKTNGV